MKDWNAQMAPMMPWKNSTGDSRGIVILPNFCHGLAPSMVAAS